MFQEITSKLSKEEVTLLFAVFGGIGVVVSAAVTSFVAIVQAIISKRSEDRRHRITVAFNLALEHWKQQDEAARFVAEHNRGSAIAVPPLDEHIIHALVMSDVLAGTPTPRNIAKRMRRAHAIYSAMRAETANYEEQLRKAPKSNA